MKTLNRIKADERVARISDERDTDDGIWIYLKPGFLNSSTDTGSIHEPTLTAALRVLKSDTYEHKISGVARDE